MLSVEVVNENRKGDANNAVKHGTCNMLNGPDECYEWDNTHTTVRWKWDDEDNDTEAVTVEL